MEDEGAPEPRRWWPAAFLLAPGSSWCYGFILAKPSWGLGVSEMVGLLLLEVVMNLGLHFRIFFPPLPSRALGEGRQQLYSSLPSARGRRRCLCLLWIYTCLHVQVALALTLLE